MVKPDPERCVIAWLTDQNEQNLFLSVITLGEIQKGISKLAESKRKKRLQVWLQSELLDRFDGRIIPIDTLVSLTWGSIQAVAEKKGKTIPSIYGLIAATGISKNMTIVTRNDSDMKSSGALLLNPWLTTKQKRLEKKEVQ
jgi:predicted nucleic acid-binding protein